MSCVDKEAWARLSPRLDELLELSVSERDVRIAQIAREDAALADELSSLLAESTQTDRLSFLEGNPFTAPTDITTHATLAGQTIGAYTLERPLGEGGMGTVWLGRRSDGRYEAQVAVKFLNLALLARGGAERFAREGSMLARLTHPNIARLLDAGVAASTTAGGQPYLVLEYIEGVSIDRYCDSHHLSIENRLRLFLDVLAAVSHAHTNLILHRDLKPSNILVTEQGQVKLLDFGIGKLIAEQDAAASDTELTQLAGRAFTPDYAAPEQVQGNDVTTATDVYALGVLLYLLLTGRHPTTLPTQTPVDRVRAVVEREPPLVSHAATKAGDAVVQARATVAPKLARMLHGDLDNIVAKALKKQATERYPTAAALADDLRRYLEHEPVSARADSLAYRASKFVQRYRLAVGAASATLLALLAGVIGTTWQAVEAQRQRDLAQQASREAQVQAYKATASSSEAQRQRDRAEEALRATEQQRERAEAAQVTAEAQRELARSSERAAQTSADEARTARDRALVQLLRADAINRLMSLLLSEVPADKPFTSSQLLERGEAWADKLFANDPRLHVEMLLVLGDRYDDAKDYKRAISLSERALERSQGLDAPALRHYAACRLGYQLVLWAPPAQHERGRRLINEGLAGLRAARASPFEEAQCLTSAAYADSQRGAAAAAVAHAERAVQLVESQPDRRDDSLQAVVAVLASMYTRAGRYGDAAKAHERTIALMERSGLEGTARMSTVLNNAAHNLFSAGATLESVAMFERVLAIRLQDDAGSGYSVKSNLANALIQLGRAREAAELHQEAVAAARSTGVPVELGRSLVGASNAYREAGDLVTARARLTEARVVLADVLPSNHPGHAAIELSEARLLLAEGIADKALATAVAADQRFQKNAPRSTDRVLALAVAAQAHLAMKHPQEATASADSAVRLARQLAGDFPYSFRVGFAELVRCQARLEATLSARESCAESERHLSRAIGADAPLTKQARQLLGVSEQRR
jgi:eukaryotic-like serine/threonine-protein kinase